MIVVVNRAPSAAFRRGQLYEEITASIDVVDVVFVGLDRAHHCGHVDGRPVRVSSRFSRGGRSETVAVLPRRSADALRGGRVSGGTRR